MFSLYILNNRSSSSSSSSSRSSSSSTQRSASGPVDEMHVFVSKRKCSRLGQKQLFKSTSMQKHLLNLKCKKRKQKEKCSRLGEMHLFEFTVI